MDSPPQQTPALSPSQPRAFVLPTAPPADLKPIPSILWIAATAVFVLLAVIATPAIRSMRQQAAILSGVVNTLHTSMTNGDDDEIFNQADEAYQQDVGQQKSAELFAYVRSQLGAPHSSTLIGTYLFADSSEGKILTLNYRTAFDKGSATETIKLHKVNDQYLLVGYTVHSPQLRPSEIPADLKTK